MFLVNHNKGTQIYGNAFPGEYVTIKICVDDFMNWIERYSDKKVGII